MPLKRKEESDVIETETSSVPKKSRKNELSDVCQQLFDALRNHETSGNDSTTPRLLCEHFIKLPPKK